MGLYWSTEQQFRFVELMLILRIYLLAKVKGQMGRSVVLIEGVSYRPNVARSVHVNKSQMYLSSPSDQDTSPNEYYIHR